MKFLSKGKGGNCPACGEQLQSSRTRPPERILALFGYRPRRCSGCQLRYYVKRG